MKAVQYNDWIRLCFEIWALSLEACWVIALRSLRVASGGPAASFEVTRMISEKVAAATSLQMKLLAAAASLPSPTTGAHRAVRHYHGKVKANRRRLTRSR